MRVFPNLYAAFDRQEVVVHSPRHVRTFGALDDGEVAAVAVAWEERRRAAAAEGYSYVHAFVNEGAAAGASRAHSHSQLVWLHETPPAVAAERVEALAALLDEPELVVAARDGMAVVVHRAGRMPYELLIAGEQFDLAAALFLLRDVVRRLRVVEGAVAWNAWLHERHLEVVPRLSALAGVELGAGIYVNSVDPVDAARALRSG